MKKHINTVYGLFAILIWSTTIGFVRPLILKLGIVTMLASVFLFSGLVSSLIVFRKAANRKSLLNTSPKYLLICGGLFFLYVVFINLAVGLAKTHQEIIEIGLLNYLWPSLTIIFSIILFKFKFRFWVILGIIVATMGIFLTSIHGSEISFAAAISNLRGDWFPYTCAFLAAVVWALYSNYSKFFGGESVAIPLFLFVTGLCFLIVRFLISETSTWDIQSLLGILYMSIFPTFLGYLFWDKAMKKGDIVLVASLSYLTPVLSTLFSIFYLNLESNVLIWFGCGLVVIGSVICNFSINHRVERKKDNKINLN